jgi:hypothetical protein
MESKTRDKWHPYRVGTNELGARVLEVMNDLKKAPRLAPSRKGELSSIREALWIRSR